MKTHKVIIVDDHILVSNSLKKLIDSFQDYEVIAQLSNGQELIRAIQKPDFYADIVLLDVNMPVMNGLETMQWIRQHKPHMIIVALSMNDEETMVINMIRLGVKGYLLKNTDIDEFKNALDHVIHKGFYYSERVSEILLHEVVVPGQTGKLYNTREQEFLKYACTDLTYKEIADKMYISPKTVDGYRETLFKKIGVKSRVGLAMFAVKEGLITV